MMGLAKSIFINGDPLQVANVIAPKAKNHHILKDVAHSNAIFELFSKLVLGCLKTNKETALLVTWHSKFLGKPQIFM